ncbi:transglutaminase family protein [bacterium]|nr:MAG: transglutaminase family protein [bacterium]
MEEYLRPSETIDFDHPEVQAFLRNCGWTMLAPWPAATAAYGFVRDEVSHSFDAGNPLPTLTASETLRERTGLCYAKSHLLAALLRGLRIPAAIRYQRVALDEGYCLHAFNSVWIDGQWFDLDARGNNARVQADFSSAGSCLAFVPSEERGEETLDGYLAEPAPSVIRALREADNVLTMRLPDCL